MSCLITNLPSEEIWVRKEYLTDHQSGWGEFVKGVWVSAKSIPGRVFYFETYLPEYAAMYDNSLTPKDPKTPDFKVSTRYYQVENSYERLAMGNEDEYFWQTAQERDSNPEKSSD